MLAPTQAVTRRHILTAAVGAAAIALPDRVLAKMPLGQQQAPYFYRFKLGNAECTVVSDGQLPIPHPEVAFLDISKDEIAHEMHDNFIPKVVLEQNVLVVNFGDLLVLFDTGMGTEKVFGDRTGKLPATLRQAGVNPADVDAVVMSHAHIDHCGGLVADNGDHNFPNAEYFIGQPDFEYWTDDAKIPSNYPFRPNFLKQARKNLLPVQDRIHFYKDEELILPGITAISAPGHTISHTIFIIESSGQQLCYTGDLAHHQVLLLERPRTHFLFDTDSVQAAESRVRMLTMLATNRIPLLAYHFDWPGIGHVAKEGDGFRYVPIKEQMETVDNI